MSSSVTLSPNKYTNHQNRHNNHYEIINASENCSISCNLKNNHNEYEYSDKHNNNISNNNHNDSHIDNHNHKDNHNDNQLYDSPPTSILSKANLDQHSLNDSIINNRIQRTNSMNSDSTITPSISGKKHKGKPSLSGVIKFIDRSVLGTNKTVHESNN